MPSTCGRWAFAGSGARRSRKSVRLVELVTRYDLNTVRSDLDALRRDLETKIDMLRRDLEAKINTTLSLRLTIRMGVMLAARVAALTAIIKL